MPDLSTDNDGLLLERLFGPEANAWRAGLNPEVVARIDDLAVEVLEGKNLTDLPEEDAEFLSRELAGRIRSALSDHLVHLQANASALGAEAKHVNAEIEQLRSEKEDIERRLQEGDCDGPA
jgi:ribosome-binding ATPase YchF (GTP1/OBG family)